MPELPEVQTTVNGLRSHVIGLKIIAAWTDYGGKFHLGKDSIKDPEFFDHFRNEVVGSKIVSVERLAKNILIHVEKRTAKHSKKHAILIHMKMTGHMLYGRYAYEKKENRWKPVRGEKKTLNDPYNRFIHFALSLSNGRHLVLSDTRKFAKVTLINYEDLKDSIHLKHIGPDPLSDGFSLDAFSARLKRRPTGRIKNVLMDQAVIAGVGNIYSDEALWRAGIHPEERVANMTPKLISSLYANLIKVLRDGIDFGGDSMSDYRNIDGARGEYQEHHQVYRKRGQRCSRPGCRGTIIRKVIGGRSAHFCDAHQKLIGAQLSKRR